MRRCSGRGQPETRATDGHGITPDIYQGVYFFFPFFFFSFYFINESSNERIKRSRRRERVMRSQPERPWRRQTTD